MCTTALLMQHVDMKINQVVVMYLNDDFVSPCKGIMFVFSVPWCVEALCEEDIQLLLRGMLACARSRTWIQLLWIKSLGARLYAYQADLLDRRPI